MKAIKILFLILCINGCSPSMNEIRAVYEKRTVLLDAFLSKSVFRSREQNYILFYSHKGEKTNQYFFKDSANQYHFIRDSIEYTPDISSFKNERGSEAFKQELISYIIPLLKKMDSLGIRDVKGDLYSLGIDLKIYMKSKGVILYVSDRKNITSSQWQTYVRSMQRIDENWYYTMDE
jgi:hypothetical protein